MVPQGHNSAKTSSTWDFYVTYLCQYGNLGFRTDRQQLKMSDDKSDYDKPARLLRPATLAQISNLLNPTKVLLTEDGYLRDWRGLAQFIGLDSLIIHNLERERNPCEAVIRLAPGNMTVKSIIEFLEKMDRYDVIDDTIALMENDLYLASQATVQESDFQPITISDFETGQLTKYDAFILYAPEDQEFVDLIVDKMEGEYGLRLCLKERDLMAGYPFEHRAVTDMISERCNFVMPIFSPNFLNSEDNKFVINFSEALGIEQGRRKIVPCVYQQCELPQSVRYYSRLDYTRRSPHWDFWDKMKRSIANTEPQQLSLHFDRRKTSTCSLQENLMVSSALVPDVRLPRTASDTFTSPSFSVEENLMKRLENLPDFVVATQPEQPESTQASTKSNWFGKLLGKTKLKPPKKHKVKALA